MFYRILFNLIVVIVCTYLFPFISMKDYYVALEFVLVMVILNIFVKPIFTLITIPITLVTFGFFLLFINAIMISIADYFIEEFSIDTFWHTLLFSFILSLSNTLFEQLTGQRANSQR